MTTRKAFTFIELIVILAILAFLLALMVPAVQKVRDAAARSQCMNNLKQITLACHNFHDANNGFPPTAGPFPVNQPQPNGSIFFHLLPYIEQAALYNQAKGYSWKNGTWSVPIPTYLCPSDGSVPAGTLYQGWMATSSYAANFLAFEKKGRRLPDFLDGTSNTIMFAERYQMCRGTPCAWGYPSYYDWTPMYMYYSKAKFQNAPVQAQCNPALPQTSHRGTMPSAFADGSVRSVADSVSPKTWYEASTPSGGEILGNDL